MGGDKSRINPPAVLLTAGRRASGGPEAQARLPAKWLQRQALRCEVLEVAREERRQWLLTRSRNWVTPDALEQRIREAIDNPVPLYQET